MGDNIRRMRECHVTDNLPPPPKYHPPRESLGLGLAFLFLGIWIIVFTWLQPLPFDWMASVFRWIGFMAGGFGGLVASNGFGDLFANRD